VACVRAKSFFYIIFFQRFVHQHHHHQFDDDDGGDLQNDGVGDDHQYDCGRVGCGIMKSVHGDADERRCPLGTGADDDDDDDWMNAFIFIYK